MSVDGVTDGAAVVRTLVTGPFLRPATPAVPGVGSRSGSARAGAAHQEAGSPDDGASVETVQRIFDLLPGSAALITRVPGRDGAPADWCIRAVTPDTGDLSGRGQADMIGHTLLELYPGMRGSEHFAVYDRVLDTGVSEQLGPFPYTSQQANVPRDAQYVVRVNRFGGALLVAYVRVDNDRRLAERRAGVERLGNVGWVVWNQVDGRVECSDQMYAILDRDPALGPPTVADYGRLIHPDDYPMVAAAFTALAERDAPYDVQYRLLAGGRTKHVRSVGEIIRDGVGQPIEMSAIVQDISAMTLTREHLQVVERELATQQQLRAEEHRLAAQLQQIILPVPTSVVTLAGMQVAVRYLPAEELAKVGGDWFHATTLPDGSVLLAIGDVAGHGLGAAATMAQLRHALAGLALLTDDPATIMQTLNTMLCRHPDAPVLASAVIGRYRPDTRELTYAQAGHPPLLVAGAASVRSLRRPPGVMLGAVPAAGYEQVRVVLDPGDLLLLFTDGLVESARVTLDAGVTALAEAVRTGLATGGGSPAALIERLTPVNPADDTCIVVARLDP